MVLDLDEEQLFKQRDVRETPVSTATATAVGLTDGKYIVVDYHADMTDERKITAGEGIDFTDGGANSTFLIAGEDSAAGNKGIVIVAGGDGISVAYTTGTATVTNTDHAAVGTNSTHVAGDGSDHADVAANTAASHDQSHNMASHTDDYSAGEGIDVSAGNVISGEDATTANKGIASFNTNHFSTSSGAVSLKTQTKYYSIPGNLFDTNNVLVGKSSGYLENDTGGDITVRAIVNLPHGAVITSVLVDGNATGDTWQLKRTDIQGGGGATIMASAAVATADTSITNATVDNSTYGYFILTDVQNTKFIWGVLITYTIITP